MGPGLIENDETFLERVKHLEGTAKRGNRHVPYVCSAGKLTIGYGHNLDTGISEAAAKFILTEDVATASAMLDHSQPWWRQKPWAVQCVLLDMCFNMGYGDGKRGFSSLKTFIDAVFEDDFKRAADLLWTNGLPVEKQRYKYTRDVKLRAKLNAELLRSV